MTRITTFLVALLLICLPATAEGAPDQALLEAAAANDAAAITAALKAGANKEARNERGASALFVAVQNKAQKAAEALLDAGANPDARHTGYMGATPLMMAVQVEDFALATMLVEQGADVNLADENGDPAINWAAYYGYGAFVDLFLRSGADTHITGHGNALEIAMRRGHQDLVRLLAQHDGVDVPSPDVAFLVDSIEADDMAGVAESLDLGIGGDALDFTGRPVLEMAARLGRTDILEQLLAAGATVDNPDVVGFTALMEAARDGQLEAAQLLLEAGADANHRSADTALNLTPMHMAALSGDAAMVTLLAEAGARVDPLGRENDTPLFWALSEGKLETAMVLLDLGADPKIKSAYGYSAADIAEGMGNADLLAQMGLNAQ